ncbi:hypothetical protein GCM10009765_69340 [Fodinicola feengrottensis]|uniref:ChrR-like cupin domain-containing protein n=1 Tax=Fodinicola feengrottensis TaxID=435914 RepID=A0ABP4UTJ4_9ACTN
MGKVFVRLVVAVFSLVLLGGTAAAAATGPQGDPVVFHSARHEHWMPCEGLAGCTQLPSRTNPVTGGSESMFRLKAGTVFTKHWHTSPEHVVGVSGTMIYHLDTGRTYRLGAGDFLYYPGKTVHWGQCARGADCIYYVYDDLPYDFHPVP